MSQSQRKQYLLPLCVDEPELVFSEGPSTSGQAVEHPACLLGESAEPAPSLGCPQEEGGPFKTPIKEMLSISSTPNLQVPKLGSPEPQVLSLSANRSLTEGLVLDTMNDSLSKILLGISFPGLEEDPLGPDNIKWSQFIPELQ
ncbi:Forkhead box protein M1 [Heterocephalus glaber]|uniref:Forkhead box protein M1 n=1 Tax=Heterocephalus glaber TaxID=10181 RepID=G5ARF5_HETGA|nr:Forkhead box protein M1 [Heterocephalus glaber]